jgi:transcriptional regulator with XRE-family HTH domain
MDQGQRTSFAALLKRQRVLAGLTQEELAERAGLSREAISLLERALRRPYPDTVRRLADALTLGPPDRAAFFAAAGPTRLGIAAVYLLGGALLALAGALGLALLGGLPLDRASVRRQA